MYAVIEASGRHFKVREGEVIRTDRIAGEPDQQVVFDRVLLAHDGTALTLGMPFLKNARVRARVLRQLKDRKIVAFRYKPKKRVRKRYGHRQPVTELRIEQIEIA
jgi:large subunit ribosomal protein L21